MIHADSADEFGKTIFDKFGIRGTPTVMVLNAEGEEIDRVVGYGPSAAEFRNELEKAYTGEFTMLALRRAFAENPEDLATVARLAHTQLDGRFESAPCYRTGAPGAPARLAPKTGACGGWPGAPSPLTPHQMAANVPHQEGRPWQRTCSRASTSG